MANNNKLIELSHKILLESERIKVLAEYVLDKETNPPQTYVPLNFINETAQKIETFAIEIEDLGLGLF